MRVVVRQEPVDRTALAWWAALGVGLGLVLLSTVLWLRQGSPDDENLAFSRELARIEPVLLQLHRGELPSPENLDKSRTGEFEPLMRALIDAARQRQQALEAYQSQVEAVSLGDWLTPANLASPKGRQGLRVRLHDLDVALESLIKRDASVQSHLDEALSEWLAAQPASVRADQARRRLLQASTPAAHVMTSFFKVERDIVAQVAALLGHLDKPEVHLALETQPQAELVFRRAEDLAFYREALTKLSVLGDRETQLIDAAHKAPEQQAKLVGAWLVARSDERR
jgi:hypothetical protein